MTDDSGSADRHRLYDLVKLTWDEAQSTDSAERTAITDEQIAAGGPYEVDVVRAHLQAEPDWYELSRDGDSISVRAVR